jgi:hypothetical protein
MTRILVALAVTLAASPAVAETKRIAVVVGNNAGSEQLPLRYAQDDAAKLARVLTELGGVEPRDLFLLQGKELRALRDTLALAKQRVATLQRDAANRVIILFYFSGHSDGEALELGRERITFAEIRSWLSSTNADVRVALVDSCKSGGLLRTKGGTPGPAFQIRLTDALSSTGEALLTSSAADELALESREIKGSYFTHHLVSGLRGAADASGDGLVTLTEAYQYAYAHTIHTTSSTVIGPQHPAYDYRLSGQGELILTELTKPTARVTLPAGFDRALLIDLVRDQVIAELASDVQPRLAVPPGRFAIRAWRGGKAYGGRVAIAAGEMRAVTWSELTASEGPAIRSKGPALRARSLEEPDAFALSLAAGAQRGVAVGLGAQQSLRFAVAAARPRGPYAAVSVATGTGMGFRETAMFGVGGYRLGGASRRWRAWAGLEAGAGLLVQRESGEQTMEVLTGSTIAGAVAPTLGIAFKVVPALAVTLEGNAPLTLLRRDAEVAAVILPGVWVGVEL